MKTYIKPLLFACVLILVACESDNQLTYNLKGKWVESVQKKDTLLFRDSNSVGFLTLSNGFEYRNGYLQPKAGSGIYNYKFDHDSIMLNPAVSDAIIFKHYYFKLNSTSDLLQIENFYDSGLPDATKMTFFRIE